MSFRAAVTRRALLGGTAATTLSTLVGCGRRRSISVLYFAGLAEGKRIKENIPAFKTERAIDVIFEELPYDAIRPKQLESFKKNTADYDVIFVDDVWMYEYAKRGYLKELTKLVQDDNIDFDDFIPKVVEAEGVLDRKIWLIPQRADVQVLFYNREIFSDENVKVEFKKNSGLDLKVPETWEEYERTARGLKDISHKGTVIIGCAETLKRPHFAFEFFATRYWSISGQDFFDPAFNPVFNNAGGVEALKYLFSL